MTMQFNKHVHLEDIFNQYQNKNKNKTQKQANSKHQCYTNFYCVHTIHLIHEQKCEISIPGFVLGVFFSQNIRVKN